MKKFVTLLVITLAAFLLLIPSQPVLASDHTITNCNTANELISALTEMQSSGGTLKFKCGKATIHLSNLLPTITQNVTIDGGNKITLSGDNKTEILYNSGGTPLTLKNIVLTNGSSAGDGGAIYNTGWLILQHVTIQDSVAAASGGGIGTYGQTNITDSKLLRNKGRNGGAIFAGFSGAQVSITNTLFQDNQATGTASFGLGGAIFLSNGAAVGVINSDLYHNFALKGGAMYNESSGSSISLQDTKVRDNHATSGSGGGVYSSSGAFTLNNVTLSGNQASNSGGGVYFQSGNFLSVISTTFLNNSSNISGGGLEVYACSGVTVQNSTFTGNSSNFGGAFENTKCVATLTNVTIFGNSSTSGASGINNGTYNTEGTTVRNSIIAGSAGGPNCADSTSTLFSADGNLSDDSSCSSRFNKAHDLNGSQNDPLLGALSYNGGATQSFLPKPASPAVNGGIASGAPGSDQRGYGRPQGGIFDRGSVEVCDIKPSQPPLGLPGDGAKVKGPAVTLVWGSTLCATKFNIAVRLGSTHGTVVFSKKNYGSLSIPTSSLTKGQTYYWQVLASNLEGKTKSVWYSFKVK